jgi:RND superfamily putative drug exporter
MLAAAARFVTGRRTKWLAIAAWAAAVVAVVGFGLPGRFADAQTNEPSSFLPEDVESVRALQAVRGLPGGEGNPAVVVAYRAGGLTADDRKAVRQLAQGLRDEPPGPLQSVAPPRYAPSGDAALITATLPGNGDSATLVDTVRALRERAGRLAAGHDLRAAVTGPAGYAADAVDVFSGINGTLLTVTALLVLVLLIVIYRSPVFWMIPLAAVGAAELCSRGLGYLATVAGFTVNGQSAGILLVLVFGAGTDYALLLVSRYREELGRHDDRHVAAELALRRAAPAILASAGTVVAALLVLLVAKVNSTAALGPIGAMGIVLALAGSLTLLPALLAATGRRAFWPFIPRRGEAGGESTSGPWRRLGQGVARHPRGVWLGGAAVLAVMCAGTAFLDTGLPQQSRFREQTESVTGERLIERAFPPGVVAPATVLVPRGESVARTRAVISRSPAVASLASQARSGPPGTALQVVLRPDPYSNAAFHAVERIRERLAGAGLGDVLVGGQTAIQRDYRAAARRDDLVVPPLVLLVVFAILAAVLRALYLPALLIASVVVSYGAALGTGAFLFATVFGFAGVEPSIVLLAFIFLVGLGVDYTIFLLTRAREEVEQHDHREGVLRALAVTGTVITSAGIVLAGTFSTLAVLPLVALTEIGFLVAFGVLLDTLIVRSILVPALALDAGRRVWWPSRLARRLVH